MVQAIDLLSIRIVVDGLELLFQVLMRHDVVVASQRLDHLLAILVHNDRLAQIASTLIG